MEFAAALARPAMSFVSGFRETLVSSLFPQTPDDIALVDEQLALSHKALRLNRIVAPLAALLVGLSEYRLLPLWHILAWPAAITLIHIASMIHHRYLTRHADGSRADVTRRARSSGRWTMTMAVVWCAMIYDLTIPTSELSVAIMFTVLACSLSAWSSIGAYHMATAAAAMPSYLIASIALPLTARMPGGWIFACLAFGYFLLMRSHMLSNYETRTRMLRLERERRGLIDNLQTAKDESDAARSRAELASRAKSAFLANMSHELRTPLNAILGFSEIVSSKAMGDHAVDQYAEYGGYIHSSGSHLLSLINDVLDLAKIEAGRFTLREREVDLRLIMDETAKMMGAKAVAGGIALAVHVERAFPNLYGDERAIRQMLVNLASNAIKFTPPGGRVMAFAHVEDDGALAFGIDDTGIGIAPEEHDKVFESFGQGRHDAILADKGTGLGLPIVKGLAEAHGGRVALTSATDQGTRVTIHFPPERARARLKAAV